MILPVSVCACVCVLDTVCKPHISQTNGQNLIKQTKLYTYTYRWVVQLSQLMDISITKMSNFHMRVTCCNIAKIMPDFSNVSKWQVFCFLDVIRSYGIIYCWVSITSVSLFGSISKIHSLWPDRHRILLNAAKCLVKSEPCYNQTQCRTDDIVCTTMTGKLCRSTAWSD